MNLAPVAVLSLAALLPFTLQDPDKKGQDPRSPPAAKFGPEALKKMEWLCGTWVLQDGKQTTEEHWRPLQGSTILGSSHTFDATTTHFFEHLRISLKNGSIEYIALAASAQQPTAFPLVQLDDGAMVFENGKHDHPQRIRYEKTAGGLTATISQLDGSRPQSFVFKKKA